MDTTILELHNTILSWIADHSGSDYIYMMNSPVLTALDYLSKHRVASSAIRELEDQDAGPLSQHVGKMEFNTLQYTIGGISGGTEILLDKGGATIISYYYVQEDDRFQRKEKGRVKISPDHGEDEPYEMFSKANITCEWKFENGSDHSYGRLEDLISSISACYGLSHTGDSPERVLGYIYDPEVGGGF